MGVRLKALKIKIPLFLVIALSVHAFADDVGRGGYAGSFLRMGLGAGGMAMGGGSVSLPHGACTAYYNPAALVYLDRRWVSLTANAMALDRKMLHAGYAQSISARPHAAQTGLIRGGFSVGWICAGVDEIDGRDWDGQPTEMLSSWENAFFFSFALNPAPKVAVGFNAKVLYGRFPKIRDDGKAMSSTGFGFDAGIMVRPLPAWTIGLVVSDLRSKYTWDSQNLYERGTQTIDAFPAGVRAGVSWNGLSERMTLSFDIEKIDYRPKTFSFGLEFEAVRRLLLRGGFFRNRPTAGSGLRFSKWGKESALDYALVTESAAPRSTHVLTWSVAF
jgi:hypothetical protein